MHRPSEVHDRIDTLLRSFGIHPEPKSVRRSGDGIIFRFHRPREAQKILQDRSLFAQGRMGILHDREVNGVLTEFRSYGKGSAHSLHVVIGRTGRVFADVDRFNPYQSVRHMVLHGALELLPHLAKRILGSAQRVSACAARFAERSRGVQEANRR
jgi:hypothetical protein